jgi:hypothetical protein
MVAIPGRSSQSGTDRSWFGQHLFIRLPDSPECPRMAEMVVVLSLSTQQALRSAPVHPGGRTHAVSALWATQRKHGVTVRQVRCGATSRHGLDHRRHNLHQAALILLMASFVRKTHSRCSPRWATVFRRGWRERCNRQGICLPPLRNWMRDRALAPGACRLRIRHLKAVAQHFQGDRSADRRSSRPHPRPLTAWSHLEWARRRCSWTAPCVRRWARSPAALSRGLGRPS